MARVYGRVDGEEAAANDEEEAMPIATRGEATLPPAAMPGNAAIIISKSFAFALSMAGLVCCILGLFAAGAWAVVDGHPRAAAVEGEDAISWQRKYEKEHTSYEKLKTSYTLKEREVEQAQARYTVKEREVELAQARYTLKEREVEQAQARIVEVSKGVQNYDNKAQTAVMGTHKHPHRIPPLLRNAREACQKKGAMLPGYREPTVLEIGAHDGKEWDELFAPAGNRPGAKHIWAVEPSPDKQAHLRAKVRKMKAAHRSIELFQLAVGASSAPMKFWIDGNNSQQNTLGKPPPWITQAQFDKKAITVEATTLDDMWKIQCGRKHITMLKIDTQGHEPAVIMSGPELFAADPPDIVHMEYSPGLMKQAGLNGVALLEFLYSFGYLCFDCEAHKVPPMNPEKRAFDTYDTSFARFQFHGGEHGGWADMVCIL